MTTSTCPKCNTPHTKRGIFCSRSCANSRGVRGDEFKSKVREKLSHAHYSKIKFSPITGRVISKNNRVKVFWDLGAKGRFLKKVSQWFNIKLGVFPTTEQHFDNLKNELYKLYHDEKLSSIDIKKYFNIPLPDGHMPAFLKQFGIVRRTICEAGVNRAFNHGINTPNTSRYKRGWHTAWDNTTHFYRSSYELAVYKILDHKQTPYQTETLRIKYYDSTSCIDRIAIPDIIIGKLVVEIKSTYTFNASNMHDKFTSYVAYGYRPMLILNGKWCKWRESNPHFDV